MRDDLRLPFPVLSFAAARPQDYFTTKRNFPSTSSQSAFFCTTLLSSGFLHTKRLPARRGESFCYLWWLAFILVGISIPEGASAARVVVHGRPGRKEVAGGKLDFLEGIACAFTGRFIAAALLLRNTEVINRNKHLDIADQLDNGKQADGGIYRFLTVLLIDTDLAAQPVTDAGRHAADMLTAVPDLADPGSQGNGIHGLHHALGQVAGGTGLGIIRAVLRILVGEYPDVPLAAIENGLFVKEADAPYRHRLGPRRTEYVKFDKEEEGHVTGIISPIKMNRLHVYKNVDDFGRADSYVHGLLDDFLTARGEKATQILQTVPITAVA